MRRHEPVGVVLRDPGGKLQKEIKTALSQGKRLMLKKRKPCCDHELRTMAGGCLNCGDPSF